MIIDWNRNQISGNTVFHFKNSLRPFINVDRVDGDCYFLDLNELVVYTLDDLEYEGLEFYEDAIDEDFKGVAIDGTIKDWFR